MSVKQVGAVLGLVFAIALAVVVGKQMSTEAMAVVVGIVCGVAAGIPTSVLLLLVLTRRERQRTEDVAQVRNAVWGKQGNYPPVVVIQGGPTPPGLPSPLQAGYWPAPPPGAQVERQFHVLGDDELFVDG